MSWCLDRRIRDNDYEFPTTHRVISTAVQHISFSDQFFTISFTIYSLRKAVFLFSDQIFTKSSTIYSLRKASIHLILLLWLMTLHQFFFFKSPKPHPMIISEDYASTHYSILTRTRFHLLVCLRRCLAEDWRLLIPIALLNRRLGRSYKKAVQQDFLSPPSSIRRVSLYLWAWVSQGQAQLAFVWGNFKQSRTVRLKGQSHEAWMKW